MIKIGQDWYFYACHVMDDGQINSRYFKMFMKIWLTGIRIQVLSENKIKNFLRICTVMYMVCLF